MKKHIIRKLAMSVCAAFMCLPAMGAFTKDYYASKSVLSSGHWVKVRVRESGMHQITDAELRAMGFEHPEKVAVYGYPATRLSDYRLTPDVPDDLPAVAMMRHDGKLIFYGEGDVCLRIVKRVSSNGAVSYPVDVVRNYYASYGTYFLTDVLPQAQPGLVAYDDKQRDVVESSWGMAHYEEELYNDGTVGARFLGRRFADEPEQSYELPMPGFMDGERICLQAVYGVRVGQSRVMPVTLPSGSRVNLSLSPVKAETYAYQGVTQIYSDAPQKNDRDVYTMSINAEGAMAGGLDFVTAAYPRHNTVGGVAQSVMVFKSLGKSDKICLEGLANGGRVWSVGGSGAVSELEVGATNGDANAENPVDGDRSYVMSPGDYDVSCAGGSCCYLVAFNPDEELMHVDYAGRVTNQNLHSYATPQMLIVASRMMRGEAERLARVHRDTDGKDVVVAVIDDVYNEFSYGTPHVMAVRRFAHMLSDKTPGRLRSVLLFGATHWDNRGLTMADEDLFRENHIPLYLREDVSGSGKLPESYATDALAGMLNEDVGQFDVGRSMMTVAVGRIPASSPSEAVAAVNKIEHRLKTPLVADLINRALIMCDKGDKNGHMADAQGLAAKITECSPSTTVYRAYNTVYPISGRNAAELHRLAEWVLKKGTAYMAYSGHATPRDLAAEFVWSTKKTLETEYDNQPFVMLATCRALYYDHPETNLGETLLYKENGGAIAVVGAMREVYQECNQQLNVAVGEEFFSGRKGRTCGEVFRLARNRMVPATPPSGTLHYYDLIYNSLSYNYIGDPEVPVPVPDESVEFLSVDGNPLGGSVMDVEAGRVAVVKGRVMKGVMTDTDFNGEVVLSIFDGPVTRRTINHDSSSTAESVTFDETLIYEGKTHVKNGVFEANVFLPTPDYMDGGNRMVAFAVGDDGRMANGSSACLNIVGGDGSWQDVAAPEISAMWLDSESFLDGDVTSGNVRLYAEVAADEVGVACGSSQMGHKVVLTLDGRQRLGDAEHYFEQTADGGGVLDMNISGLADGWHELSLRICNHAGVHATRSICFTVVNSVSHGVIEVDEYPASDVATLRLTHDFNVAPSGRLIVKDASGKVVFTDDNATFPYEWPLTDAAGLPVAEGRYAVEAYLRGGAAYGKAAVAEVVVSRD